MKLVAACAFGLEAIVKRELIALGYTPRVSQPGRIEFEGDWSAVCRTNVWLRTADRVLIVVQQFDAPDFDALFETVKAFDWSELIPRDASFPVIGRSRLSQLTSVPAVQRSVKRALVESLKRFHGVNELPESGALFKVEVALLNDVATLTIDTTGPSLHKRGYRKMVAEAPLKETLAAAMVSLSVWNPERPLIDPFCGSGTIPIEAALVGLNIAPGINRQFTASDWTTISNALWESTITEAHDLQRRETALDIIGADADAGVLELANYHCRLAGIEGRLRFHQQTFSETRSPSEYGCIITNPPYGERLEDQDRLIGLYESIPGVMQGLPTWSLFLITNMLRLESLIQKSATRRRKLFNGRLECTYFQFLGPRPPRRSVTTDVMPAPEIADRIEKIPVLVINQTEEREEDERAEIQSVEPVESVVDAPLVVPEPVKPLFGGLEEKDHEQAQLFHNRLVKLARHLRRWPSRRQITCFRLYERDIPEIPLVVDRYEDYLHITEYERPSDRHLARHTAWLELMKTIAANALGIPESKAFLKQRHKNRDSHQYEKVDSRGEMFTVSEGGLKFLINLSDYVDTGLFLDHRLTREMVRSESGGKAFLNLFAYTGSFTVYAASGGAASTTTVDLSKNYLDWARKNLEANGLAGPDHQFIAEDSIDFLRRAKQRGERFDLAVVDPPTYSNSKRTDLDWDVQTRHVELLELLHAVMNPGGVVYFSMNFRRFKLREEQLTQFEIHEISKQTVPEDFRNRRIHRCWRMVCLTASGS